MVTLTVFGREARAAGSRAAFESTSCACVCDVNAHKRLALTLSQQKTYMQHRNFKDPAFEVIVDLVRRWQHGRLVQAAGPPVHQS